MVEVVGGVGSGVERGIVEKSWSTLREVPLPRALEEGSDVGGGGEKSIYTIAEAMGGWVVKAIGGGLRTAWPAWPA